MKKLLLVLICVPFLTFAQQVSVSEIAKRLEQEQNPIKATYDWVAENIKYDVAKLNKLKAQKGQQKARKKTTVESRIKAKVDKVLKTKRGVCEDYSYLFDAIVKELGYQSFVVTGYSKKIGTQAASTIGHAWNAVKVDGIWKLYDTTWGAGQVKGGKKFIKKYTDKWYDVPASEMIKTHMPYDPIWQLLQSPISYEDFKYDRFEAKDQSSYNFETKIDSYLNKDKTGRTKEELERSKTLGEGPGVVKRWRNTTSKNLKSRDKINELNQNSLALKEVITDFNAYLNARKKRFKDETWTLEYAQQQLPILQDKTQTVLDNFRRTRASGERNNKTRKKNIDTCRKIIKHIGSEIQFLKKL